MDVKVMIDAMEQIAVEKGISLEEVKGAVLEALKKGFIKKIHGEEDSPVEVHLDEENLKIIGEHKRIVVPNDYFNSDMDIRLEDAKRINKKAKIDDEIVETYDLTNDSEIGRAMALAIKSALTQKLAEAEKTALYARFHDKKDEMITGEVERCTVDSVQVKITNGPSIYVSRKDLIGDEMFAVGQQIRLYVADVAQTGKGSQLKVTRASEGFLKRIFEEEIHEVYDGTVIIKGIARLAGVRSKVAVYTSDDNVDPIGAIIGPNGTRIQRVVNQLGNGKEKIDVFLYKKSAGLYICEALRPAQVRGISIDEAAKKAIAVVDDGQSSLAIGKKFANIRLAQKLTGYEIEIIEETEANNRELTLKTPEELTLEAEAKAKQERMADYLRQVKAQESVVKEEVKETAQAATPVQAAPKAEETVVAPVEKVEETVATETVETSETPVVHVEVKTTSSLDELEKEIEDSKKKAASKQKVSKTKRPKKIEDDEVEEETAKPVQPAMAIYTEEELAAMEAEEEESEEEFDDEDYDEYDEYDKYYDDEN